MKPSERIFEIYEENMKLFMNKPGGDWPFMTDEEKYHKTHQIHTKSIVDYLDEQAEQSK